MGIATDTLDRIMWAIADDADADDVARILRALVFRTSAVGAPRPLCLNEFTFSAEHVIAQKKACATLRSALH